MSDTIKCKCGLDMVEIYHDYEGTERVLWCSTCGRVCVDDAICEWYEHEGVK